MLAVFERSVRYFSASALLARTEGKFELAQQFEEYARADQTGVSFEQVVRRGDYTECCTELTPGDMSAAAWVALNMAHSGAGLVLEQP